VRVGGRERAEGLVLHAHPDAEPHAVAAGRGGSGREALEVLLVLDVVAVQVPRQLDLVGELVDGEVDALGVGEARQLLLLAPAAGGHERGEGDGDDGEAAHPGAKSKAPPPWRAPLDRDPPRGSTAGASWTCAA